MALPLSVLVAAEVGRVAQAQHRVDHQRAAVVIVADLEAHLAVASDHEPAGDGVPDSVDRLVGHRGVLDQVAAGGVQHQVALGVDRLTLSTGERQPDRAGVGPGLRPRSRTRAAAGRRGKPD